MDSCHTSFSQTSTSIGLDKLQSFAKDTTLILLCAGDSSRLRECFPIKKQWLSIAGKPLWLFVADKCVKLLNFACIRLCAHPLEQEYMKHFCSYDIIAGGESRQDSLINALKGAKTKWVLISDVARFGIGYDIIARLFSKALELGEDNIDCVVPILGVPDTVVYEGNYIKRENLARIQTPQLSKTSSLLSALKNQKNTKENGTDESSIIAANGGKIAFVKGGEQLKKITFMQDLSALVDFALDFERENPNYKNYQNDIFIGNGIDVHEFIEGKEMALGGIKIDCGVGFKAHSDGDVALHSLIDALLGAIGAGDIGQWFPDNDPAYKNADSKKLLKIVVDFIQKIGFSIGNVDMTILAQKPKISPYKRALQESIANLLGVSLRAVNIKATTTEHLGFIGREEGVCVMTSALLKRVDWIALFQSKQVPTY